MGVRGFFCPLITTKRFPPCLSSLIRAPICDRGLIIRFMGLLSRESSPVRRLSNPWGGGDFLTMRVKLILTRCASSPLGPFQSNDSKAFLPFFLSLSSGRRVFVQSGESPEGGPPDFPHKYHATSPDLKRQYG